MQCTHHRQSRSALYTRCMDRHDPQGNAPFGVEHSAVNGIFVHPLYRPAHHHGGRPRTSPTGCVHILGSLAVPCTLGVRFRMMLMVTHHSVVNTLKSMEFSYTCCTDKNSVYGRMLTAEWLITMSIILNRTPSVQGATGLPRMCTQNVGEVRGPPLWSCTGPYRGCTKIRLAAELPPPSGALP